MQKYTDGYSDKTIRSYSKQQDTPLISLRPAEESDIDFIFSSWLKSYRGSLLFSKVQSSIYFPEMHKLIEKLLRSFSVIVACNPEDPSQIYGWICAGYTQGIFCLHYIYVKHTFRKLGVGKLLFNSFQHDPGTVGVYTHTTKLIEKLAPKYNMVHHPFILLNDYIPVIPEPPMVLDEEKVQELEAEVPKLEESSDIETDNNWKD